MLCPVCKDKDHRLTGGGMSFTTAMYSSPYWENGVYHSHDANRSTTHYECSNGHLITVTSRSGCPAGDLERVVTEHIAYKCDVCKNYGKDTLDDDCKRCIYESEKKERDKKTALEAEYRALPGWQRRRIRYPDWVKKRES